jgi:uncharacterized protein YoxC
VIDTFFLAVLITIITIAIFLVILAYSLCKVSKKADDNLEKIENELKNRKPQS